jgi:hypothetical protein
MSTNLSFFKILSIFLFPAACFCTEKNNDNSFSVILYGQPSSIPSLEDPIYERSENWNLKTSKKISDRNWIKEEEMYSDQSFEHTMVFSPKTLHNHPPSILTTMSLTWEDKRRSFIELTISRKHTTFLSKIDKLLKFLPWVGSIHVEDENSDTVHYKSCVQLLSNAPNLLVKPAHVIKLFIGIFNKEKLIPPFFLNIIQDCLSGSLNSNTINQYENKKVNQYL